MTDLEDREFAVRLRALSADDGPLVIAWRTRPEVAREMFQPPPTSEAEHRSWFAAAAARGDRFDFVIEWGSPPRPVGTVGLSEINRSQGTAEFGILIGEKDARGRGIARQASRLLLGYGFNTLDVARIYLHVFADNAPAIALYRALGFREEGRLRAHRLRKGVGTDVLVMGLLRSEWSGAPVEP